MSASVRGWFKSLGGVMCLAALATVLSIAVADEPREREGDKPAEGRGAEVGKLEQRIEQLEREAKELRQAGDADALESRMRELRGIRQRLAELRGERREGGRPEGPPPEVRERLGQLKSRIQELREAGKKEEAAQMEREAREIMQRFAGPGARPGDGPRVPPEAREKLERMRAEVQRLRDAGEPEKAAELERQGREMLARFGAGPGGPPPQGRLQHLRAAAEHLRAAGMPDMAERIEVHAKQLAEQDGARDERRPEKPEAERERKEPLQKEREAGGDAKKPQADGERRREQKEKLQQDRKEAGDRQGEKPQKPEARDKEPRDKD